MSISLTVYHSDFVRRKITGYQWRGGLGNQSKALQCRHLHVIHVLNAWAARAECTTTRSIAIKFPGCIDGITTERSFKLQATRVIHVVCLLFDMLSIGVCTTRNSGRRLVDWCRNQMPTLHLFLPFSAIIMPRTETAARFNPAAKQRCMS